MGVSPLNIPSWAACGRADTTTVAFHPASAAVSLRLPLPRSPLPLSLWGRLSIMFSPASHCPLTSEPFPVHTHINRHPSRERGLIEAARNGSTHRRLLLLEVLKRYFITTFITFNQKTELR